MTGRSEPLMPEAIERTGHADISAIEEHDRTRPNLFLRLADDQEFLTKASTAIVVFGCTALFAVCAALILPGSLGDTPREFATGYGESLLVHLSSPPALIAFGTIAFALLLDLAVLGYRRSAIASLLRPDQSTRTDIAIFIFSTLGLWRYATILSFFALGYILESRLANGTGPELMSYLPSPFLQAIAYLLVHDCLDYWRHRLGHRVSWWWETHQVHHSATRFNVITVGRSHPVDLALTGVFVAIPMALIGTPIEIFIGLMVLRSLQGKLQHSMVHWDFGWFGKHIFLSPIAHRIHHSPDPVHWDKNFGHIFVFWDKLFGTWYSGDVINEELGLFHPPKAGHGFVQEMLRAQLRFLGMVLAPWDFRTGVISPEEAELLRNRAHVPAATHLLDEAAPR